MKKKGFIVIGCLFIAIMVIAGVTVFRQKKLSTAPTAYYIIYSDMLKKNGGVTGIDISGNPTFIKSLKIQDVSKYNLMEQDFIAGGSRANNHLIIDENGSVSEFYLLDNPDYSGVTAITGDKENIIAVMNGNITNNTYQNLFVIQDKKNNILEKEVFDIYASDILLSDNIVYIVGSYLNEEKDQWSSKIIQYSMKTKDVKEKVISKDRDYKKVLLYKNQLYCMVGDMNGKISEIDILDRNSLDRIDTQILNKEISAFFCDNNFLYYVLNNTLYKMENDENMIELLDLLENTYVSSSIMKNNHIYLFCRKNVTKKERGKTDLGTIIDYDIANNTSQSTPIKLENKVYDDVIFFPAL